MIAPSGPAASELQYCQPHSRCWAWLPCQDLQHFLAWLQALTHVVIILSKPAHHSFLLMEHAAAVQPLIATCKHTGRLGLNRRCTLGHIAV